MSNNDDIDNEDDVVCVDYTTVIVISSVVGAVPLVAFILIFQFIRYDSISRVLYIFLPHAHFTQRLRIAAFSCDNPSVSHVQCRHG